MNRTFTQMTAGACLCLGLAAGLTTDAGAKAAWQAHAGGEAYDAAKGGIAQTQDGGFITVGEASSFSPGGDYDVYVVKNDICGNFEWAYTFDIGGNDHGRRVRETPDGGFIITGETENTRNCCTRNDAFLMKLARDGSLEWTKTFGGKGDDRGTDVQLYYRGEKGYLVSGHTSSFGAGRSDGWLIATDVNGSMLWSRVYGGVNADGFNGLTQLASGDIVATGFTRSYGSPLLRPSDDLFLVRTNDQGDVAWSWHYGSAAREVGNAVIESSPIDGEREGIVVAGFSTLTPKAEAYLLRVNSGGNYVTDHLYGSTNGRDEFRDLTTVPWGDDIFAIGRIFEPKGGLGLFDVFAIRVDAKLNPLWARAYGGEQDDEGYGITPDIQQGGFGWAGSTFSFTYGKEDMYLGLAFSWGESFCKESEIWINDGIPEFKEQKAPTGAPQVWVECDARVSQEFNKWYEIICSTCLGGGGGFEGGGGDLSQQRVPLRSPEQVSSRIALTREQAAAINR